jgi:multidrug efflux pump subunit AcrA (membrane-fusion protein)
MTVVPKLCLCRATSHRFVLVGLLVTLTGCGLQQGERAQSQDATLVDVAIAHPQSLQEELEYIGSTGPAKEISLRAQADGQLLRLNVKVGDRVKPGQAIAQLDGASLASAVSQAQAELAARESEVSRAENEVENARLQIEQAQNALQQNRTDSIRLEKLYREGAISARVANAARSRAELASLALRSAQAQVKLEQETIVAAKSRVKAQQVAVKRAIAQKSFASITSPIEGVVLKQMVEPGRIVRTGDEILKLGDFEQVTVKTQVSELEVPKIRVGQTVQVALDALAQREFTGKVSRVSASSDPTVRLVPVEVTINNPDKRIGNGLLARVRFAQETTKQIVVPETALQRAENNNSFLFVVQREGAQAKVNNRPVSLGNQVNGQVEVVSGLSVGESFVLHSDKPLKDGEMVRLSAISRNTSREPLEAKNRP